MPAANISIANPTSARKAVVGSAGSSQRKPLVPITTPARSSPTTTGISACLPSASSGPARPASTIRARTPNVITLIVLHDGGLHRVSYEERRRVQPDRHHATDQPGQSAIVIESAVSGLDVLPLAGRAVNILRRGSVRGGGKGRLKPIEEGNLRCLHPSARLVEIEPLDAVDLGECLDDA